MPKERKKMLYIFDLDGTLRGTLSNKPCPNDIEDQYLLPGVEKKLKELHQEGHVLAVASNQGGVSWGWMTEMKSWEIALKTNQLLGGLLRDIRLGFYHREGIYRERYKDKSKPRPDMLLALIQDFESTPVQTCFVGNENVDKLAAQNAGCQFSWAHLFFGWGENIVSETPKGFFARKNGGKK